MGIEAPEALDMGINGAAIAACWPGVYTFTVL